MSYKEKTVLRTFNKKLQWLLIHTITTRKFMLTNPNNKIEVIVITIMEYMSLIIRKRKLLLTKNY